MKRVITIACIVLFLAAPACNRAKKPVTTPQIEVVSVQPKATAPKTTKSEPAKGSIKEAILALNRAHFAYNSAKLLPKARQAVAVAADKLKSHPDVVIYVAGHCDERGSAEYNQILGEKRARAVVKELVKMGVPKEQLQVISYGKDRPETHGRDSVSYAKNRRVEFEIIRGDVRLVIEPGAIYDDKGRQLDI